MNELITYIKDYAALLKEGAVWHNTNELLAPVMTDSDIISATNYVYEFYCYISIIIDLMENYDIVFVKGSGAFEYKFPQAAAAKKGKPRFNACKDGNVMFQICAGTKINCKFPSEENHPDISFQLASAPDDPDASDLILIMDAKYRDNSQSKLPKTEVYKFAEIVDLYDLRKKPIQNILFHNYKNFFGNCLITNGASYSDSTDVNYLQHKFIKEVEHFSPSDTYSVIG